MKEFKLCFLLALLAFCSTACGVNLTVQILPNGNIKVNGDNFEGVIFTSENAAKTMVLYPWNSKSDKGKYWTPDVETVKNIEEQITRVLGTIPKSKPQQQYKRQYFGVRDRAYEREDLVLVNLFCDNSGAEYWTKEGVFVKDGGTCYIRLLYSKSLNFLKIYQVNGYG